MKKIILTGHRIAHDLNAAVLLHCFQKYENAFHKVDCQYNQNADNQEYDEILIVQIDGWHHGVEHQKNKDGREKQTPKRRSEFFQNRTLLTRFMIKNSCSHEKKDFADCKCDRTLLYRTTRDKIKPGNGICRGFAFKYGKFPG